MENMSEMSVDEEAQIIHDPLPPPPLLSYPDKESLMKGVQTHAREHGYNTVIKTSSMPTEKKPGRSGKVWLRCDRGGRYRPRNGLTDETRKRKRSSRLIGCPFLVVGNGASGIWTVQVIEPDHNHGPSEERLEPPSLHKVRRGCIRANPYDWPHDAGFSPFTCALLIIDMQSDSCAADGYLGYRGIDISAAQSIIPTVQSLLGSFRDAGFPIYFTREGHRPDLSTLSSRERFRVSKTGGEVGSPGPLGNFMIRGEAGHDILPALYPIDGEPIIDKAGQSAFAYTDLELLLRNKNIKSLVLAGLALDTSVMATMRDANDRGFDCIVLEDATAAQDAHTHANACEIIQKDGGILGAVGISADVIRSVDNIKRAVGSMKADVINPQLSALGPDGSLSTPQRSGLPTSASPLVFPYTSQGLTAGI